MATTQEPWSAAQRERKPDPHPPFRKTSLRKLHSKRPVPRPLWATSEHQLRGFNPSPVNPLPRIADVTASSEHAFAGRDERQRRPFKPPLGVQALRHGGYDTRTQYAERPGSNQMDGLGERPPSSPLLSPAGSPQVNKRSLRSSRSVGEGLRGLRHRISGGTKRTTAGTDDWDSIPSHPSLPTDGLRESFRSAVTSDSSFLNASSINTDYSSLTGNSSHSDFVKVYPNWPDTDQVDYDMSVEDAIGMYADGFESAKQSLDTAGKTSFQHGDARESLKQSTDTQRKRSFQFSDTPTQMRHNMNFSPGRRSFQDFRPASRPEEPMQNPQRPYAAHRRSQSASLLFDRVERSADGKSAPHKRTPSQKQRTFTQILSPRIDTHALQDSPTQPSSVPRDRYGFKKTSHYITAEQYDAWNVGYSEHLARRRKKWHTLMKSYGLAVDKPFRFPPKSDKIKRYVRKGIPPELRGAAWFWYAGGPHKLAQEPGLYWELVQQVENGRLGDSDREHIERDLNRTFPDNVRFKPDPTTTLDAQAGAGGGKRKSRRATSDPETPILRALRRVLQAFAVHNPAIGYCQSLNFIAGLLLLFLDEDEEKAFVLLNIVTSVHLPGTHGVALEGANIDIAVLMTCIKDSLPPIWAKLDDKTSISTSGSFPSSSQALCLPTVSLATTAWFMSLFVGTLPIESVLRVWDCLFFEGSKTLFRIALAIFKFGSPQILAVSDSMEIFQVVQTLPRKMLDVNALVEVCFRRRGGFGHVSQELIERRREERRVAVQEGVESIREEERKGWKRWRAKAKV